MAVSSSTGLHFTQQSFWQLKQFCCSSCHGASRRATLYRLLCRNFSKRIICNHGYLNAAAACSSVIMSSNLESLKKTPRQMLQGRPFQSPAHELSEVLSSKESEYFEDIMSRARSRLHSDSGSPREEQPQIDVDKPIVYPGVPKNLFKEPELGPNKYRPQRKPEEAPAKTSPSDMTLMSTMITRINQLERHVEMLKRENHSKDKEIDVLKEKCELYQKRCDASGRTLGRADEVEELRMKISEMESFLRDYGLIWVGEDASQPQEMWSQQRSIPASPSVPPPYRPDTPDFNFVVNFDQIVTNIRELNALAGEDSAKIETTSKGAILRKPDAINLELYANGILLFDGPFRPFTDTRTMQCVQDLMDGYFPAELQGRYPEGVPFKVSDRRERVYIRNNFKVFSGDGDILGKQSPKRDFTKDKRVSSATKRTVYDHHHSKSVEQFMKSLPPSVIRNGNIIPVRKEVQATLQGSSSRSQSRSSKTRSSSDSSTGGIDKSELCEVKVGLLDGTDTLVKLRRDDKISDIKKIIHIGDEFDLVFGFPATPLNDRLTLEQEGLAPKALIRVKAKSHRKPKGVVQNRYVEVE